jgi:hypothetical protein
VTLVPQRKVLGEHDKKREMAVVRVRLGVVRMRWHLGRLAGTRRTRSAHFFSFFFQKKLNRL